jgi:hypothetical protein
VQRCQRYQGLFLFQHAVQKMIEDLEKFSFESDIHLSHADFTAANLVLEKGTGTVKIIDNELFTQNCYYIIDLFNTCRSINSRFQDSFVETYLNYYVRFGGNLNLLMENAPFFNAMWHIRSIGSLLQSGGISHANKIAQQYLKGEINKQPIIRITKELSK